MTICEKLVELYNDYSSEENLLTFECSNFFGNETYYFSMVGDKLEVYCAISNLSEFLRKNYPLHKIKNFSQAPVEGRETNLRARVSFSLK